jgi:D-alanyl-D-alanine carboxypeptidase/D-alanyl-D-alanine-endopeptidase (penicillin-binding protein 4)
VTIREVKSPPLRRIVRFMNQVSDNFTAEILVKHLGQAWGTRGTTPIGVDRMHAVLNLAGLQTRSATTFVDGSGLAGSNRTTTRKLVDLVNVISQNADYGDWFVRSLAIPGKEGTLSDRMRGVPGRSRVRAKTGTLNNSSALTGLATGASGTVTGFAIVTYSNSGSINLTRAHKLQDRVAAILVAG